MRICIIVADFGAGGAQRVIASLAQAWARGGHAVRVCTFGSVERDFFELPRSVVRRQIGVLTTSDSALGAIRNNVRRLRGIRNTIRHDPTDVVVSFMDSTNVTTLLATIGLRVPIVVSERTYPPRNSIRGVWSLLRRIAYPKADALVMQTELGAIWARRLVRMERIWVIANPLAETFLQTPRAELRNRQRAIVAAGRLVPEKGFDLLLAAFAESIATRVGWVLRIFGDGPERANLARLAQHLRIDEAVRFEGVSRNLERDLAECQIFALSSRFEGFPNTLVEAMSCGCAVVAADCESGPREIIRDGTDGLLVDGTVGSLRQALDTLIGDTSLRERLGRSASEVRKRYSLSSIADQWLQLFDSLRASEAGLYH